MRRIRGGWGGGCGGDGHDVASMLSEVVHVCRSRAWKMALLKDRVGRCVTGLEPRPDGL